MMVLRYILVMFFLDGESQDSKKVKQGVQDTVPGDNKKISTATFAGGCFWCTEADFEKVPGVVKVISGYTGGNKENPTYREVSAGTTDHVEAVQVYYDPSNVS